MAQIIKQNSENHVEETSAPSHSTVAERDVSASEVSGDSPLPSLVGEDQTPAHLASLADRARGYVAAASSANTRKAYASDWKHFAAWCRRSNLAPLPPHPQTVGLYITACASGHVERSGKPNSVSTIERRLSSLSWNYAQRGGQKLDRRDRHIATVMAGIRNSHARPPVQKEAVMAEDIIAMVETLDRGSLRGLRDRAMLLIGFAGGLRRSEIVDLDLKPDQTEDGRGWIEILDKGMLVTLRGKTGWREVEIGRGSSDATCPVTAVEMWIKFAKLAHGPLFRRVTGQGKAVGPERLNDKEVARLVKRAAMAAGVRGDLSEIERAFKFSGHSLRAGLASSAEVDERYVQKQLGHSSAEMTRRYQRRRDRFRVNLTKASGL
ncbi:MULTISPECIES: site-specific integrase [Rhizobium/Agrobacterium group]|uniref:Integrase protein n=2 Tax=Rhizobium/Agrobacterium group TaxID=227290 RepID=B9K498_ALLAM|nr:MULTISPECIES: site-specific integrase [Rhizobium/Agrobacterium group]ACM39548.1 integrase protein [Allorhizobium ampelinum S4]ASK49776.1 integrase [Agrobacterium vitis]MCF1436628.1 site-specific integrase [Allorhizobium ampelinum]MCF1450279.1 site-specific integrase [Allorhizobium ampelinum]MCF1495892.1 site-specific integrase [Allorhizobium ampelinum]